MKPSEVTRLKSCMKPTPRNSRAGLRRSLRTSTAVLLAGALASTAMMIVEPAARADTRPTSAATPPTVSADPLPTWQLDGVVWSQVVVGTTVYVTGAFTKARPPGAKVGSASQIDARNLFAYDIRTGNPVSSFKHRLGGPGLAIAASPDGKRVYVGGDFTTVDNQARLHVAAFDTATGALVTGFAPAVNGSVKALAATNAQVFIGGSFNMVSKVKRKRLASTTTAGKLTSWAPKADDGPVLALVVTPDKSTVVAGGQFSTLNGVPVWGMGALSSSSGAGRSWAASSIIKNYDHGATNSLTTDGQYIYGSGFAFGAGGKFEGSFSLTPRDGTIRWMADCLGDTYDVEPVGPVVYTASHAHNCTMIGAFPDTVPRTHWQRAGAFTNSAAGVNKGPDAYGWSYKGRPAPKMLQWYPKMDIGEASGQNQAVWNVVSAKGFLAYGGEFPRVNGRAQQGLVRFALSAVAPNKVGPTYVDTVPPRTSAPPTRATAVGPGSVRVRFGTAWDLDNQRLTYQVYRDRGTAAEKLISSITKDSNFWTVPDQTLTDVNVPAGSHTYQVRVSDPFGNVVLSPVSDRVAVQAASAYAARVTADGANHVWRMGESTGPAFDSAQMTDGAFGAGVKRAVPGARRNDSNRAASFTGATNSIISTGKTSAPAPKEFSVSGWFNTRSKAGGELVGFGSAATGTSKTADRHVYLDKLGRLAFGVRADKARTITSPKKYNDGKWHLVVATFGSQGMALYVDGKKVAADPKIKKAANYQGHWRVGGGTISGWPNKPPAKGFSGTVDDVATYGLVLSATQVKNQFSLAGPLNAATR